MNDSLKPIPVIILFLVFFIGTQLSATIVGTTKGEFSVNQGTANYNLKIDVPPQGYQVWNQNCHLIIVLVEEMDIWV